MNKFNDVRKPIGDVGENIVINEYISKIHNKYIDVTNDKNFQEIDIDILGFDNNTSDIITYEIKTDINCHNTMILNNNKISYNTGNLFFATKKYNGKIGWLYVSKAKYFIHVCLDSYNTNTGKKFENYDDYIVRAIYITNRENLLDYIKENKNYIKEINLMEDPDDKKIGYNKGYCISLKTLFEKKITKYAVIQHTELGIPKIFCNIK